MGAGQGEKRLVVGMEGQVIPSDTNTQAEQREPKGRVQSRSQREESVRGKSEGAEAEMQALGGLPRPSHICLSSSLQSSGPDQALSVEMEAGFLFLYLLQGEEVLERMVCMFGGKKFGERDSRTTGALPSPCEPQPLAFTFGISGLGCLRHGYVCLVGERYSEPQLCLSSLWGWSGWKSKLQ